MYYNGEGYRLCTGIPPGIRVGKSMRRTIQSEMNDVIRQVGRLPASYLMDEAETYICALCDMERKPCEIHAGVKCAMMIREGTELELLRSAEKEQLQEQYGHCVACGNVIEPSILMDKPLAELCPSCLSVARKVT
jgi:RNA polymerase-binding transcription factor DksA